MIQSENCTPCPETTQTRPLWSTAIFKSNYVLLDSNSIFFLFTDQINSPIKNHLILIYCYYPIYHGIVHPCLLVRLQFSFFWCRHFIIFILSRSTNIQKLILNLQMEIIALTYLHFHFGNLLNL